MEYYKISDIIKFAEKMYNLNFTDEEKKAVRKAIERNLKKANYPKSNGTYLVTETNMQTLVNEQMFDYFAKKAKIVNPLFDEDKKTHSQIQNAQTPIISEEQAISNLKLDIIIKLLENSTGQTVNINTDKFHEAYSQFIERTASGLPMPGYSKAKANLENYEKYYSIKKEEN